LVKLADPIPEEEVARARAQLKAGLLMSLESPSSRCEQFARQMLVFGRPLSSAEIIEKVEAVDAASLNRFATRLLAGTATLTALGPIAQLEDYGAFAARFR
jgi:predicted Zn-dependent peptidase